MLRRRGLVVAVVRGANRWAGGQCWPLVVVFGCASAPPGVDSAAAEPLPGSLGLAPDACTDDRYPALAGAWALGCSDSGRVDLAVHLESGLRVVLSEAVTSPGLAAGALYAPGVGVWTLPEPVPVPVAPMIAAPPIAPPAFDGARVALSYPDGVEVFPLGETVRKRIAGRPRPGVPPALRWPDVAWLDADGPRLHTVDGEIHTYAAGPDGPPVDRGVVSDPWRVWFSGSGASVWVDRHLRTGLGGPADAAFVSPVAVAGPVLCAEVRPSATSRSGVRCEGATVAGEEVWLEGHTNPSVAGPWLLSRTETTTVLTRFDTLEMTRGDRVDRDAFPPRAEGDCAGLDSVWDLDWPAAGWEVAFETANGDTAVVPLDPGRKTLTWPCARAAVLRPAAP